jgi:uncharacterized protein (DUF362 family)/NAD-dependent dihydropyrimidine dehydrogenase PreA subunit
MSTVVVIRCNEYDVDTIEEKLRWGLQELGGIESIIPLEKKLLLNPNWLVGIHPDKAATTHPSVFEALLRILQEKGYTMSYGDSPGFGDITKVSKKCGFYDIAQQYGVPLADFTNGQTISYPEGRVCKQFEIANAVLNHDAIINLCKMKAHAFQRITGAIKNPFGCVVGLHKGLMHSRYQNAFNFAEMLIDLDNYLGVDLHIMDGIVAMEGNGPRNGTPTKMNVLLLSTDPVALDAVFCQMVDLNPAIIPTITYGEQYGLGTYHDITIVGDKVEDFVNPTFNIDRNPIKQSERSNFMFLRKHVLRRPYIIEDLCKKCGVCVEVCPLEEKAVNWSKDGKSIPPVYDYDKCIRCYCCQEMCPHDAIDTKTPVLGKVAYKLRLLK